MDADSTRVAALAELGDAALERVNAAKDGVPPTAPGRLSCSVGALERPLQRAHLGRPKLAVQALVRSPWPSVLTASTEHETGGLAIRSTRHQVPNASNFVAAGRAWYDGDH